MTLLEYVASLRERAAAAREDERRPEYRGGLDSSHILDLVADEIEALFPEAPSVSP